MKTKTKTKTPTSHRGRSAAGNAALSQHLDELWARVGEARRALAGVGAQGVSQVEKHPVGAVVGAFATGVAVAKLIGRG
jgi:hypothetical protein